MISVRANYVIDMIEIGYKIWKAKIDWNDEQFVEMMGNISNENSSKYALNFIYQKNEYKNINKVKKDKDLKPELKTHFEGNQSLKLILENQVFDGE